MTESCHSLSQKQTSTVKKNNAQIPKHDMKSNRKITTLIFLSQYLDNFLLGTNLLPNG